ncbi:DNA-binding protein [Actinomadura bangladeshensis]|uniref:DNA-binding protein n=2 Tax=Actinomadura TaxID=1988 RepID=A0A4R4PC46_9ACTN|nr:DNA-binding protein [Actinomadura bangladeshensis]
MAWLKRVLKLHDALRCVTLPVMSSSPGSEIPMERLLYTPQEAAEITSFTRDWLVRAASRGEIPHRRYGKRLFRFAHEDLEAIKDMGACPVEPAERWDRSN